MTDFAVPDYIEPIVGWRYWRLGPRGRLASLHGEEWVPGRPKVAACPFARYDPSDKRVQLVAGYTRRAHDAPREGCICGLYAARDLKRLRGQMLFGHGLLVVGEVSLWGKVIPGLHGYRAEKAYPRQLYVPQRLDDHHPGAVAGLGGYAVPVEVIPGGNVFFSPPAAVALALASMGSLVEQASSAAAGRRGGRRQE